MALTKDKKQQVIEEITDLLNSSKMTVVAKYKGTSVKQMQELRKTAIKGSTVVKVVKNRLVIQAIKANSTYKDADTSNLIDQLIYAFNANDEVAPAQSLADFAKKNPTIQFVGGYTADGKFMSSEGVTALSKLPGKPQMIAGIINTLNSPVRGVMSSLNGNLGGLIQSLEAKAS